MGVRPWTPPGGARSELVAAGTSWDAVRVSARCGHGVIDRLGEDSGAVIEDTAAGVLYWLVYPGGADGWRLSELYVNVLGATTYLVVPPVRCTEGTRLRWALPLTPTRYLTSPQALHDALAAEIHAASGPR